MEKIKKIFLEENLSWKKLLVFSVACGVITGIIPLINYASGDGLKLQR